MARLYLKISILKQHFNLAEEKVKENAKTFQMVEEKNKFFCIKCIAWFSAYIGSIGVIFKAGFHCQQSNGDTTHGIMTENMESVPSELSRVTLPSGSYQGFPGLYRYPVILSDTTIFPGTSLCVAPAS